jgi:enamine deaminase RidA (YjgF/YER057c/UK114 family)
MQDEGTTDATQALALLDKFAEAYNRHDVDGIMSLMTEDCTFVSYFGPDSCGQRFSGAEQVRTRVAAGLHDFPDARWDNVRHFVSGGRGVTEWTFRGTRRGTAELVERQGCDLFSFRDNKIWIKDTYQKWRMPTSTPLVASRQEVEVPAIHRPVGRYAHAVKVRDLLFVSGCGPFDEHARLVGANDIVAQTTKTLENVKAILDAAGMGFANVMKETVYLTNIEDRTATRAVRERFYGASLPACTLIEISRCVHPDMLIEIDVVASL